MSMSKEALEMIFAAYKRHPEFLGTSITDVNQRGAFDSTLLHIAARTGNVEHVKALIELGADVNIRGDLENTPLHDAALCGQADVAVLLLSLGADPKLKNEFDQTALDVAQLGNKVEVSKVLGK
jgi:ankyrin repeat protein